jgi:hypothetical protein
MSKTTLRIKFSNDARCTCGGQIAYDARFTKKLPLGLGFVGGVFQIDKLVIKGWAGECTTCGRKVLAEVSRKHCACRPQALNHKIQQARLALA